MIKNLAGTLFIRQGVALDYCFEAAIRSLQAFCGHVFICYVQSEDETYERLKVVLTENTSVMVCSQESWDEQQGRQKLSYFTNRAIEWAQHMGYEYQFNLQGDEVITPESIPYIKRAVELGEEGYYVTRHNFWKDEHHVLNVLQSRKPVSTVVNRLTKTGYRSIDDAESIACNSSLDFINLIEINHYGFIRNNVKHIAKIKEMQQNIFLMDYDKRADLKPEFDYRDWGFTEEDIIPHNKQIPPYAKEWLENRNK